MLYDINENTTIYTVLYRAKNRYIWEPKGEDYELIGQNDVVFKDIDGEEFSIIDIDLEFGYFDEHGDNEELEKQCTKALKNLENWKNNLLPALSNLRLSDVVFEVVKPHKDVYGARGYTLRIYISIWEVEVHIEPDYIADQIEKAQDNKYIVMGNKMNNLTNAKLFKKAIETWQS